ncbi:MAG: hypothetical protein KAH20_04235 [Methylococcales bacterium]|nr:hypothetical protein [Methylococcales bacterium]
MKIKKSLFVGVFILNSLGSAVAEQTISASEELHQLKIKYNNLLLNSKRNDSLTGKSKYIVQNVLPESPGTPNYKFDISTRFREDFSIIFWRQKLSSNGYTPLVRIEPNNDDGSNVCDANFTVVQNGKQFDDIELHSGDGVSLCGSLFVGKTLILDQKATEEGKRFDIKEKFTVIYEGLVENYKFEIPSLSGENKDPLPNNKTTVDNNLDIHMPTAVFGSSNIWADLEYKGKDANKKHVWHLKEYGVHK